MRSVPIAAIKPCNVFTGKAQIVDVHFGTMRVDNRHRGHGFAIIDPESGRAWSQCVDVERAEGYNARADLGLDLLEEDDDGDNCESEPTGQTGSSWGAVPGR